MVRQSGLSSLDPPVRSHADLADHLALASPVGLAEGEPRCALGGRTGCVGLSADDCADLVPACTEADYLTLWWVAGTARSVPVVLMALDVDPDLVGSTTVRLPGDVRVSAANAVVVAATPSTRPPCS